MYESKAQLKKEIRKLIAEVDSQIKAVKKQHKETGSEVSIYEMRHTNGVYVMSDLLTAKAHLLHALILGTYK